MRTSITSSFVKIVTHHLVTACYLRTFLCDNRFLPCPPDMYQPNVLTDSDMDMDMEMVWGSDVIPLTTLTFLLGYFYYFHFHQSMKEKEYLEVSKSGAKRE